MEGARASSIRVRDMPRGPRRGGWPPMRWGRVVGTVLVMLAASVAPIPAASASGSPGYVRAFENVVHGTIYDVTPQDVAVTGDSGALALATTESPRGPLVNWLV